MKIIRIDSDKDYTNKFVGISYPDGLQEPIFIYTSKPFKTKRLYHMGPEPVENIIYIDKLEKDIIIIKSAKLQENSRTIIVTEGVASISAHIPDDIKNESNLLPLAVSNTCRSYGINSFLENNDIKIMVGDLEKKIFGQGVNKINNDIMYGGIITFVADTDFMDNIINFNHISYTRKGITSTKPYIGGICEVVPNINRNEFMFNCGVKLAELIEQPYELLIINEIDELVDINGVKVDNWLTRRL